VPPRIPPAPLLALCIGAILTWAYAWVLDDAFVYFRYADNAALLGGGLVFNQGEYVEGYTSPLWMLLLVAARALHLRYWPVLLTVGVFSLLATWMLAIRTNRRLCRAGLTEFHLPALWLTSCYAVQSHFTSGLETPLVQVVALAFAGLVLEPESRSLKVLVGLGPLVRPELGLAFAIAVLWCGYRRGRVPWTLLAVGVLTQAAWLAFRLHYYADFVPNTFHIKDTAAPARGLHYLHDTLRVYYLYWLLGGAALTVAVGVIARSRRVLHLGPRATLWMTALLHTAYVVRIGGDFVHYRYLAFPTLVLVASLGGVVEPYLGAATRRREWASFALGTAVVALMLASYPTAQLPRHPLTLGPTANALAMYRVDGVEDAASHRGRGDLAPREWDRGARHTLAFLRNGSLTYAWVGESGWCRDAYEHLDWYVVQSFGLTDPVLAHVVDPFPERQAGHRWSVTSLARDLVEVRLAALASGLRVSAPLHDGEPSLYLATTPRARARWIDRNLPALDAIEHRTHRPRAFWRDVVQALEPWPEMVALSRGPRRRGRR
jgi:hypothetical protein